MTYTIWCQITSPDLICSRVLNSVFANILTANDIVNWFPNWSHNADESPYCIRQPTVSRFINTLLLPISEKKMNIKYYKNLYRFCNLPNTAYLPMLWFRSQLTDMIYPFQAVFNFFSVEKWSHRLTTLAMRSRPGELCSTTWCPCMRSTRALSTTRCFPCWFRTVDTERTTSLSCKTFRTSWKVSVIK